MKILCVGGMAAWLLPLTHQLAHFLDRYSVLCCSPCTPLLARLLIFSMPVFFNGKLVYLVCFIQLSRVQIQAFRKMVIALEPDQPCLFLETLWLTSVMQIMCFEAQQQRHARVMELGVNLCLHVKVNGDAVVWMWVVAPNTLLLCHISLGQSSVSFGYTLLQLHWIHVC